MRAIRTGLNAAGMPVENSKGEASAGQEEINVRYAGALESADAHAIVKNAVKEIAWSKGRAVTFMAKYDQRAAGSSSHLHQSLRTLDGQPAFFDAGAPHGMSKLMRAWVAGLLAHAGGDHLFPRALRQQLQALRGRDLRADQGGLVDGQPHRRLPAGRRGHARRCGSSAGSAAPTSTPTSPTPRRSPPASTASSASWSSSRSSAATPTSPARCRRSRRRCATRPRRWRGSAMLRAAFGDEVVEHYLHAARWEQAECDRPGDRLGPRPRLRAGVREEHDGRDHLRLAGRRQRLRDAPGRERRQRARAARGGARGAEGLGGARRSTSGSRWCARASRGSTG